MAERRMIHKKISLSEQFNDMGEFAQLVFVLMIPHADDWGSLKGTARVIRGMAIPLNTTRTDKEVESALQEMEKQELVWRYRPDGEGPMLQLRRWEDHQTGLGNRTKPKRKLYYYCEDAKKLLETAGIDWDYEEFHKTSENLSELQKDSPVTKQNRTKQKRTKGKGTRKRDPLLDHWAIKCYKHVVKRHVKTILRGDWVAFADKQYEEDDDANFDAMKADMKKFMAMGYFEGNIEWFMQWVKDGKPEKWAGGKSATHKRSDGITDEEWEKVYGHLDKE